MAITNQSLIKFFDSARQKRFTAGEIVLNGEEPTGVVYIQKGFVQVYSISDEGNRYIHIIYKDGELFPLIWALNNVRRRIFYEAISDVMVAEAPREDFLDLIKKDAAAANDVLRLLAGQFYVFADRLDNLEYKSAPEKVAYRLAFLASRFGERKGSSVVIKAPLTHGLISESINLARETVSREIEKLERRGILGYDGKYIVVKDIDKLGDEFSEPITLNLWGLKEG